MRTITKESLVGKEFTLNVDTAESRKGTKVYVHRIDYDGDIVVRTLGTDRLVRYFGKVEDFLNLVEDPALANRWIVWTDGGMTGRFSSEEAAKKEAELLATVFGDTVYLAQAQNMVKKEAMVWYK